MMPLFVTTLFVIYILLVVVRAMTMPRSGLSRYELQRRADENDHRALRELRRESLRLHILALHRLWESLLVVAMCLMAITAFGWFGGAGLSLLLVMLAEPLSQIAVVKKIARKRWPTHEKIFISVIEKYPRLARFLANDTGQEQNYAIHSREELMSVIESAPSLTSDDKRVAKKALSFGGRRIREIMTPRKEIISISQKEVLGPLTLTALHKTGHSHLPVVEGPLDNVIGVLVCGEVLNTERQEGLTVADAMHRTIHYLHEHQTLQEAVNALLRTKAHLFIVVDSNEKTVGIITFSDIIAALFGHAKSGAYHYEDKHEVAKLGAASYVNEEE